MEREIKAAEVQSLLRIYGSLRAAAQHLRGTGVDINHQKLSRILRRGDEDSRPMASGVVEAPDKRRTKLHGKRFVFTSAQNNTYVHDNFFKSLIAFCEHNDAQLIVSKFTYNKSGFQNAEKDDDGLWYDPRLEPFFVEEAVQVADKLVFNGELNILPTAQDPLSGFDNYNQHNSGIIPHAKVRMKSVPRMKGEDPRFLYTTGAVTLRNYIQKKAGQKAEFHHVFGALFVEIDDDGDWFARQLIADNSGSFYDITTKYGPDGIETGQNAAAINWGDIHFERIDDVVMNAAWGERHSMLSRLKPQWQFIHDLTDFRVRNHHNIKDPHFLAEMMYDGTDDVEKSIKGAAEFLKHITRSGTTAVVVESNHDLALTRWLKEADIRVDPKNAEFFHRANAQVYKQLREGERAFNVFAWTLREDHHLEDVIFLKEDDSFVICSEDSPLSIFGDEIGGIECGLHGHNGPNGGRGSAKSFTSIGRKCNIGHSHSAGIVDGVYVAGVACDLDLGYNKGPSSWSHSHIVTYPNGKRTIITMKRGKWKA